MQAKQTGLFFCPAQEPLIRTTMTRKFAIKSIVSSLLLCGCVTYAAAQGSWPTRAITMIVPFPPGGLADLVARPVAEAMSRDLGQPVVIEN